MLEPRYLINEEIYNTIVKGKDVEVENVFKVAKESNVSTGIVVSGYYYEAKNIASFGNTQMVSKLKTICLGYNLKNTALAIILDKGFDLHLGLKSKVSC